jgi:DNA polymerase-4
VVPPDDERSFLDPLAIERLWGVGPATSDALRQRGISRVGQVAQLGEEALVAMLGPASGRHLYALAHNRDPRRVQVGRRRGSIGAQRGFGLHTASRDAVDASLVALVDRVTRRMRAAHRVGRTVTLRLRFGDYARATRSHTLTEATAHTATILATARGLLRGAAAMVEERALTLIGVAVSNLDDDAAVQLALPFDQQSALALDAALDGVRDKFGTSAVTRAVLVGRDPGIEMPMLPD